MEKEAEQLKLNALNIKSVLTSGNKKLKKITYKKRNLDRIAGERKERRAKEKILESSRKMVNNFLETQKTLIDLNSYFQKSTIILTNILKNNFGKEVAKNSSSLLKKIKNVENLKDKKELKNEIEFFLLKNPNK